MMLDTRKCRCCGIVTGNIKWVELDNSDEFDSVDESLNSNAYNINLCKDCAEKCRCGSCEEVLDSESELELFFTRLESDKSLSQEVKDKLIPFFEGYEDLRICINCYKKEIEFALRNI